MSIERMPSLWQARLDPVPPLLFPCDAAFNPGLTEKRVRVQEENML